MDGCNGMMAFIVYYNRYAIGGRDTDEGVGQCGHNGIDAFETLSTVVLGELHEGCIDEETTDVMHLMGNDDLLG
jgi:hypothetical protein